MRNKPTIPVVLCEPANHLKKILKGLISTSQKTHSVATVPVSWNVRLCALWLRIVTTNGPIASIRRIKDHSTSKKTEKYPSTRWYLCT